MLRTLEQRVLASRRKIIIGVAAASGLVVLAVGPAAAQSTADWAAVEAAAKKEGELVLYYGNPGNTTEAVAKAFTAKYGIPVSLQFGRANELRERVRLEAATGRPIGDIGQHGITTSILMEQDGLLQPHGDLPNAGRLSATFQSNGVSLPNFVHAYGILVNTRLVPAGQEPRKWADLADPKWKGKILSDDVRALGGGNAFFTVTYDKFGRSFHEALATQNIEFTNQFKVGERRVANGEKALWIPQILADVPDLRGLPVKLVLPEEGSPYILFASAIFKSARHPNAARLFMNFLLEDAAQLIHANAALIPVTSGLKDRIDPQYRDLSETKLLGTTDASRQDQITALAKSIYK